jgi:hypothetical protein
LKVLLKDLLYIDPLLNDSSYNSINTLSYANLAYDRDKFIDKQETLTLIMFYILTLCKNFEEKRKCPEIFFLMSQEIADRSAIQYIIQDVLLDNETISIFISTMKDYDESYVSSAIENTFTRWICLILYNEEYKHIIHFFRYISEFVNTGIFHELNLSSKEYKNKKEERFNKYLCKIVI